MTTTYTNTAAGYAQAVAEHGEDNLLIDPFAGTITVKPAEAAPADRYVTAEQFRDRFSDSEMVDVAASNDPIVRTAILKITTRDDGMVPVNDETRGVLDHMVSIGLLTAGRPAQLLA